MKDYSCFISAIVEQVLSELVKKNGTVLDEQVLETILARYSNSIKENYPNQDPEKRKEANSQWRLKHQNKCSKYLTKARIEDKKSEYLKYRDIDNKNPKAVAEKQRIKSIIEGDIQYSKKLQKMIENKVIEPSCLNLSAVRGIIESKKTPEQQNKLLNIYIPGILNLEGNNRQELLVNWTKKETDKCDKFFKKHGILDEKVRKDYFNKVRGLEATVKKIEAFGGKLVDKQRKNSIFETDSVLGNRKSSVSRARGLSKSTTQLSIRKFFPDK